jgi:hypothetical protein
MEFSEATASNRVEILCTAVKDAKCHAVQQTAVLLGGLGGFQNSWQPHRKGRSTSFQAVRKMPTIHASCGFIRGIPDRMMSRARFGRLFGSQ